MSVDSSSLRSARFVMTCYSVCMFKLAMLMLVVLLTILPGCGNREIVEAPNPYEIDVSEYDRMFEATHHVLRDFHFRIERSDYRFGTVLTEPRGASTVAEFWRQDNTTFEQMLFATANDLRRTVRVTIEPWDESMAQSRRTTPGDNPSSEVTEATMMISEPTVSNSRETTTVIEEIESLDASPTQAIVEIERETTTVNAGVKTVTASVVTEPAVYGLRVDVLIEQRQLPDQYITNSATSQVQRRLDEVPHELAIRNIPAAYWLPVGRDVLLENRILAEIVRTSTELTGMEDFNFIQP